MPSSTTPATTPAAVVRVMRRLVVALLLAFVLLDAFVATPTTPIISSSSLLVSLTTPTTPATAMVFPEAATEMFRLGTTPSRNGTCDYDIHVAWSQQLGASVFATPMITDLQSDGTREILISTMTHYVEALNGVTGHDVSQFPFTHPLLRTQTSVLPVDLDANGVNELMVSTYSGSLVFLSEEGEGLMGKTIKLPPVPLPKAWWKMSEQQQQQLLGTPKRRPVPGDWVKNMTKKHQAILENATNTGVNARASGATTAPPLFKAPLFPGQNHAQVMPLRAEPPRGAHQGPPRPRPLPGQAPLAGQPPPRSPPQQPGSGTGRSLFAAEDAGADAEAGAAAHPRTALQQPPGGDGEADDEGDDDDEDDDDGEEVEYDNARDLAEMYDNYYRRQYAAAGDQHDAAAMLAEHEGVEEEETDGFDDEAAVPIEIGTESGLSLEARRSMDLIYHPQLYQSFLNVAPEHDVFTPRNTEQLKASAHAAVVEEDTAVFVDAHLLATPVVCDLDNDGGSEAVLVVSYFFDHETYPEGSEAPAAEPDKYMAVALVLVDLVEARVQWNRLLHVSTSTDEDVAYSMASPLVINSDSDRVLEIFATTPSGLIVGYDARGVTKPGWPVQVKGSLVDAAIAVDINDDGIADICTGDTRGFVYCFDRNGKEMLQMRVRGSIVATPTAGDVDGDGHVDLVVGTSWGYIFALDPFAKRILPGFPVRTGGAILSSALLVRLNDEPVGRGSGNNMAAQRISKKRGLDIIVPSDSGNVYVINARGCHETIDLGGERSVSMVLADDVTGDGNMNLIVTTTSGTVAVYETGTPFHPMKQWLSKPNSMNGMTASEGYLGVYFEPESRTPRDVRGDAVNLRFTIMDERRLVNDTSANKGIAPRYMIYILLGRRLIVNSAVMYKPGSYRIRVQAPLERVYTTVSVIMATPNALRFEDTVSLSFNMHFLDGAKYLLVIPFVLWCFALTFVTREHTIPQTTSAPSDPFAFRLRRHAGRSSSYA